MVALRRVPFRCAFAVVWILSLGWRTSASYQVATVSAKGEPTIRPYMLEQVSGFRCPCTLSRLDPATLKVSATRSSPWEMPQVVLLAGLGQ